jgi:hypothetical protein
MRRAAPGIDLVDRLSRALGTPPHDLPMTAPPDTLAVLRVRRCSSTPCSSRRIERPF